MNLTLKDKYDVFTQYPMLVGIFDNSIESQMYRQIMNECDWEDKFSLNLGQNGEPKSANARDFDDLDESK